MPKVLMDLSSHIAEFEEESILASCQNFVQNYESLKQPGSDGELGKTAKFWIMYLDLMKYQQMAHNAVQENDLEMRILAWESMLPYYFYFNNTNYARYGTYCLAVAPSENAISWNETIT